MRLPGLKVSLSVCTNYEMVRVEIGGVGLKFKVGVDLHDWRQVILRLRFPGPGNALSLEVKGNKIESEIVAVPFHS